MNPTILLATALFWVASVAGSLLYGIHMGRDLEVAANSKAFNAAQMAIDASNRAAADAIAKIKVNHVNVTQPIQREIQEKTVYRECRHSPEQLQRINSAITGTGPVPPGESVVSTTSADD